MDEEDDSEEIGYRTYLNAEVHLNEDLAKVKGDVSLYSDGEVNIKNIEGSSFRGKEIITHISRCIIVAPQQY